jgi:epoxyqueuosine reductase
MEILLHSCCAPCSIVPIERLRGEGATVHGFWFNPNIHPVTEYRKRRETLEAYSARIDLPMVWRDEYRLEEFMRMVAFHEAERCRLCIQMRIEAAGQAAKEGKFGSFTTSLLYSKYQPHDLIAEIGEAVGKQVGVPFLYRDFRDMWREGVERSKAEQMYRQPYCGCIYSEKDRYWRK